MYYLSKILVIISAWACLLNYGCKKEPKQNDNKNNKVNRELPGFYDINFKTIFSYQDNHNENDEQIKKKLNAYYNHLWKDKNLSGGILVARGNNILLEKYTGYSNFEKLTPITSTTPVHVASVSKILTSLIILKLVEAEKIQLDQKVNTILTSFPYPDITIENLLTHRSGLPNYAYLADESKYWDKSKRMTNSDVANLFSSFDPPLLSKPGTHFAYCNTNFALLALIAEKISKKSFPETARLMVFEPLKMNHSYIFQEKDMDRATPSYYPQGKPYAYDHLDLVYGDKNLYTTPKDLFKLSQAMYAPNFLRIDLLNKMFTPYSNEKQGVKNYGLGMRMMIFDNGKKLTYHTGWWHGSNTIFVHLLDEKVTIIALGNKFSKVMYSALSLSSLFGNYPLHNQIADLNEHDTTTLNTTNKILDNQSTESKLITDSLQKVKKQKNQKL
ncbi:serine hydrolase [Apibacter raozihei]|uniref:serine hydrolase domain-containing protein n=1 Tax=Apibacter raozihei TaxID=2500547 RepID=UPI000FE3C8EB|nr:serine hydrolase domain-containing protein [Apibacter raozihei]